MQIHVEGAVRTRACRKGADRTTQLGFSRGQSTASLCAISLMFHRNSTFHNDTRRRHGVQRRRQYPSIIHRPKDRGARCVLSSLWRRPPRFCFITTSFFPSVEFIDLDGKRFHPLDSNLTVSSKWECKYFTAPQKHGVRQFFLATIINIDNKFGDLCE